MFCPECGNPTAPASNQEKPPAAAETSPPTLAAAALTDHPAAPEIQTTTEPVEVARATATVATATNKTARPAEPGTPHGARERAREGLHRASSAARGAIEDNVKRVEKIHHVSTAMIEEAHYDSSLRFVLVALGLFVVFIVLLILSKVMG
jgi:hypothetical protein